MSKTALEIIHGYIGRYLRMLGHSPTAEHLATIFDKPVEAMRLALASYSEARQSHQEAKIS